VGRETQRVVATVEGNEVALEEDVSIDEEVGGGCLNATEAV
jgi:hypothetical protein